MENNQVNNLARGVKEPGKRKYLIVVGIVRAIICIIAIILLIRSLGYFEFTLTALLVAVVLVVADIVMIAIARKKGLYLEANDALFVNLITIALPGVSLSLIVLFSSINCQGGWLGGSCQGFGIVLALFILLGAGVLYLVTIPITILAIHFMSK